MKISNNSSLNPNRKIVFIKSTHIDAFNTPVMNNFGDQEMSYTHNQSHISLGYKKQQSAANSMKVLNTVVERSSMKARDGNYRAKLHSINSYRRRLMLK